MMMAIGSIARLGAALKVDEVMNPVLREILDTGILWDGNNSVPLHDNSWLRDRQARHHRTSSR
jgi:hypothetical protein